MSRASVAGIGKLQRTIGEGSGQRGTALRVRCRRRVAQHAADPHAHANGRHGQAEGQARRHRHAHEHAPLPLGVDREIPLLGADDAESASEGDVGGDVDDEKGQRELDGEGPSDLGEEGRAEPRLDVGQAHGAGHEEDAEGADGGGIEHAKGRDEPASLGFGVAGQGGARDHDQEEVEARRDVDAERCEVDGDDRRSHRG